MARQASESPGPADAFEALHNAFCDGVEVSLGRIAAAKVNKSKRILAHTLQATMKTLTVKNILVQARGS